ncbi:inositol 2-dehydrogenase [Sphingopyxis macrogoltabida]|uniref:Inositol 2-dehydrogenase n=1 Tax=Sphingopyxis macrogoltabida TaxID=33050 RepID=A0AAC8YYY3_SPHMC|nr:inositol 2-dehydrogenase [Sphingopyxis macrogoltabida]ALJ13698.1 myo-inositol 2-dehydrogenase [Sphingopyxis macrogoltabida]AMU88858.1 inositol 2-dehydrogenase [Sphingopyxis macrogoltabida]
MHDIALIGAGRIGKIHAANLAANPRLRLARVVDPFPDAAAAVAAQYDARVSTIEEALADPAIAGVVVASSTDTHLPYSLAAAEAGKAIFCEKPLDQDLARARESAARFAALDACLFLAFNRRFDPNFAALQARLAGGAVGNLETLHIVSHDPAPPPVDYVKVSGGIFKDMVIHDFDMARWLLGEEVTEVFASASVLVDPAIGEAGDADTAKTILRTASGRLCVISSSRRSGYGYDQRIEAFGSTGMIRAQNQLETTVETWGENGAAADRFQNFFLDRYAVAYAREAEHFADILDGAAPLVDFRDGVAALALAEAAAQSAQTGERVLL